MTSINSIKSGSCHSKRLSLKHIRIQKKNLFKGAAEITLQLCSEDKQAKTMQISSASPCTLMQFSHIYHWLQWTSTGIHSNLKWALPSKILAAENKAVLYPLFISSTLFSLNFVMPFLKVRELSSFPSEWTN